MSEKIDQFCNNLRDFGIPFFYKPFNNVFSLNWQNIVL